MAGGTGFKALSLFRYSVVFRWYSGYFYRLNFIGFDLSRLQRPLFIFFFPLTALGWN